jgi:hypothetical protein
VAGIVHHSLCHPDLCNGTLLLPVSYNQVRSESRENVCVYCAVKVRWGFEIDAAVQALHRAATRHLRYRVSIASAPPCMRELSGGGDFRALRSLIDAPSLPWRALAHQALGTAAPARNQELRGGEVSRFFQRTRSKLLSSPSERGAQRYQPSEERCPVQALLVRRDARYNPSCV